MQLNRSISAVFHLLKQRLLLKSRRFFGIQFDVSYKLNGLLPIFELGLGVFNLLLSKPPLGSPVSIR
jgi:hypothetical protein